MSREVWKKYQQAIAEADRNETAALEFLRSMDEETSDDFIQFAATVGA